MTVLQITGLDKFLIRIYSYHNSRPDLPFCNNFECYATDDGVLQALLNAIDNVAAFLQEGLLENMTIFKGVASTWQDDSGPPYNPDSFVSVPLSLAGQRSTQGLTPADLRVCWFIKKTVDTGRYGKMFLRGVLTQEDLTASAGVMGLALPNAMGTLLSNMETAGNISGGTIAGDGLCDFKLALISDANVRDVNTLVSSGVAIAKFNHRYFDRPGA